MRRHFWKVAMCALALAGASANAMPIGVRTMMHARVAVRQAADEAERLAWTGNDGWTRQADGSWKSGPTTDGATNSLTKTVNGAGTVTFRWKTSCEDYFYFKGMSIQQDALVFLVDGTEMGVANGIMSDWAERTFSVEGAGSHTLAWSYIKDVSGAEGEDCAWLDCVTWTPAIVSVDVGGGKSVSVPQTWLDERPEIVAAAGGDKTAALQRTAVNGRKVWECYVLGLDPAEATNDFRIVSIEMVDGKPKVEWEPKVNRWTGAEIQAVLKGAERLEGPWAVPEEGDSPGTARPTMRFFKLVVEVP